MRTRANLRMRLRPVILLAFCVVAASPAVPQTKAAAGPAAARQLRFEVSDYRDPQGKRWIHLSCEFEYSYQARMEDIIVTLWDFPRAPKIFSRIESVRVLSDTGTVAVTDQRTAVRVLGLAFISNLVFRSTLTRRNPDSTTLSYETIKTDGSCLSAAGAWYLEEKSASSGPSTYARYSLESYVEPRFPGQAAIMRGFGAADVKKVMRELGQAMARG